MFSRESLVSRLQQTIVAAHKSSSSRGFEAGCEWATTSAEAVELRRLEVARSGYPFWDSYMEKHAYERFVSPSEFLLKVIRPEAIIGPYADDSEDFEEFWEPIIGKDFSVLGDYDWIVGFACGAISVWDTVADEVWNFDPRAVVTE
jgi:hypothetical protein